MSPSEAVRSGNTAEDKDDENNGKKRTPTPASSRGSQTSPASAENSPSAATFNIRQEYTQAMQTDSYNEIWSKIHHQQRQEDVINNSEEILRPDQASVNEAIRLARPTRLTRLVSRYLESSEQASNLFLSLRRSVDLAHEIYAPIALLLDVLPASSPLLSPAQSDTAFDAFADFDSHSNPFQYTADGFGDIRDCFSVLKQQLELRILTARRRHRFLRKATIASATCLVVSVTAAVAAALVIASHALLAVAAIGPVTFCCGGGDVFEGRRRILKERMKEADAAARETYVLDKHLSTVERLVARLYETVESDKVLVRFGLERGRGQINPVQEIVRQLRKNYSSFCHQLTDLDEHICLCLAALNRARFRLLLQIQRVRSTG